MKLFSFLFQSKAGQGKVSAQNRAERSGLSEPSSECSSPRPTQVPSTQAQCPIYTAKAYCQNQVLQASSRKQTCLCEKHLFKDRPMAWRKADRQEQTSSSIDMGTGTGQTQGQTETDME